MRKSVRRCGLSHYENTDVTVGATVRLVITQTFCVTREALLCRGATVEIVVSSSLYSIVFSSPPSIVAPRLPDFSHTLHRR